MPPNDDKDAKTTDTENIWERRIPEESTKAPPSRMAMKRFEVSVYQQKYVTKYMYLLTFVKKAPNGVTYWKNYNRYALSNISEIDTLQTQVAVFIDPCIQIAVRTSGNAIECILRHKYFA